MKTDWTDCPYTEVVEGKQGGVPLVKYSRVPADLIPECAELGETPEEIAYDYSLKIEDVRDILAYAAEHSSVPIP